MAPTRLKSSFIYLANAVNDLRANWKILALVIAPLALAVALCLLPDALNFQHRVAQTFEQSGGQRVSFTLVQEPYRPDRGEAPPVVPVWITFTLHPLLILITIVMKLVMLCALQRIYAQTRASDPFSEAVAVYRRAIQLAPAFGLIVLLQWLALAVGFALLIIPGLLVYVWLYFATYALVFDDRHSWTALLYSRDLMRKRFIKVAVRVVVFLAVWSGYNSWAAGVFVALSLVLGPVGAITNSIAATIFLMDLFFVAVSYATAAFFIAAGLRLYQDLSSIAAKDAPERIDAVGATGPLTQARA